MFRNLMQPRRAPRRNISASLIPAFVALNFIAALALAGCAAPGQPITRRPPAPTPISDLSARQVGNSVSVTFTLPKETVQGRPLSVPPQIDIYREFVPAPATAQSTLLAPPRQQIITIPSQTLQQYRVGEPYSFSDVLSPADLSAHAGSEAVYMVRTRTANHDSANSNVVAIPIFPAPQPVADLQSQVTRSAIILSWTPAPTPEAASTLGIVSVRYRIYRSSKTSAATSTSPLNDVSKGASVSTASIPFRQVGELSEPPYRDSNFTFGQTYAYYVVSVAQYGASAVESEASRTVEVTPRDTFPPPTPTGLVTAVAPATASTPAHIDLSWDISPAPNVAGYNIYRSTANTVSADRWDRLNRSPLLTPAFRDIPEVSGKQYFYRVTVVDTFGNESAPSASVNVSLPATSE
ncbi:MAG: fibronectin type III domain-containing protein [Candidatus Acidiferrales bacterium]